MQQLAILTLLVSAADHWTTYLCLRDRVPGWQVSEANPLAAWLFASVGLVPGLALDTAITVGAVVFVLHTRLFPFAVKCACLGLLVATTGYAVANNLGAVYALGLSLAGGR